MTITAISTLRRAPGRAGATALVAGPTGLPGPSVKGDPGDDGLNGEIGPQGLPAWGPPIDWATGLACVSVAPATVVRQGGATYVCILSHTATTFSADFDSGRWSLITPKGDPGARGDPGGAVTIRYTFSTATPDADPGNGGLRLGSATQNTATVMRADLLDRLGVDWTAPLNTFANSTNAVKGLIRLVVETDPSKWLLFEVSALASPAGYRNITVTCIGFSSANPFANGEQILLAWTPYGNAGASITGPAGTAFIAGRSAKSSAYTAVAGDKGVELACSGTFTLGLTAAATLGANWYVQVRNVGTGIIRITSAAAGETIDGVSGTTGIYVYPGESFTLATNGSIFETIGRQRGWVPVTSIVPTAVSTIDFTDGFADSEAVHARFVVTGVTASGQSLVGFVQKSGSWQTGSTYSQKYNNNSFNSDSGGTSDTLFHLSAADAMGGGTGGWTGTVEVYNIKATSGALQGVAARGYGGQNSRRTEQAGFESTNAAITGFRFSFNGSTWTAQGRITLEIYRA